MKTVSILPLLAAVILNRGPADVVPTPAHEKDFYPEYMSAKNFVGRDGTPELEKQPFLNDKLTQIVYLIFC